MTTQRGSYSDTNIWSKTTVVWPLRLTAEEWVGKVILSTSIFEPERSMVIFE